MIALKPSCLTRYRTYFISLSWSFSVFPRHTHTDMYTELDSLSDSPAALPYQVRVKSGSLRAPPISLTRRESVTPLLLPAAAARCHCTMCTRWETQLKTMDLFHRYFHLCERWKNIFKRRGRKVFNEGTVLSEVKGCLICS